MDEVGSLIGSQRRTGAWARWVYADRPARDNIKGGAEVNVYGKTGGLLLVGVEVNLAHTVFAKLCGPGE